MTENEIKEYIEELRHKANTLIKSGYATSGISTHFNKSADLIEELLEYKLNGSFSGVELAQLAAMQMRLRDYQEIGTIEEFKALKEKRAAKKPRYEKMVYPKHKWREENGKVDEFAFSVGYCNGPVCERCYYSFCEHCNPDGWNGKCVVKDYICPSCNEKVGYKKEHCDCGQKLDWSE